ATSPSPSYSAGSMKRRWRTASPTGSCSVVFGAHGSCRMAATSSRKSAIGSANTPRRHWPPPALMTQIKMTGAAHERWTAEYPALSESGDRLTDHMTARAEAQVIRLAVIYALLDRATAIEVAHLEPALALWRFCKASSSYVFGELTGDGPADVILAALRGAGATGMMKRDVFDLFGRNLSDSKIDAALARLHASGRAVSRQISPHTGAKRARRRESRS